MRRVLIPCMVPILFGCSVPMLPHDKSVQTRINTEMQQAAVPRPRAEPAAPLPPTVSNSLLPPLRAGTPRASARQLEQRFDLKVTDAPIGQVLLAIVQDTPYSVLLSPKTIPPGSSVAPGQVAGGAGVSESLTVNLKDVTVFEALDSIREMYGYEYAVDGNRIFVQPPEMRTKLYQVNYILGQRRGVSDLQVVAGASPNSSSGGGGGGGNGSGSAGGSSSSGGSSTGSSYPAMQSSGLSSMSKSDIWGEMEDAVRTVLGCQIARSQPRGASGGGSGSGASSATASNNSRADVSYVGDSQTGERMRGSEGCSGGRAMTVNQMSGIVVVRGLPKELRQVESLLRSMQLNIERQVIIEAKIIEVELNSGSQQGINWSGFRRGMFRGGVGANPDVIGSNGTSGRSRILSEVADDGTGVFTSSMGDLLGGGLLGVATPNAFSAGLGVALQFSNFSALINFLESQGRVQVLSSPRIATLNNQKAVLKVGSEEPFVTNITAGVVSQNNNSNISTPPTINYQPFFSGIALDVTPQIDENDNITLHVHSMVNSITEKEKIAAPSGGSARVPFAVNSINETDSVVKARDGQVIVIGGLMTESSSDSRDKVPFAGDVPVVGALFGKSGRATVKRELVILLKPTVVKGDDAWTNDINASQSRIERMNVAPAPRLMQ